MQRINSVKRDGPMIPIRPPLQQELTEFHHGRFAQTLRSTEFLFVPLCVVRSPPGRPSPSPPPRTADA